MPDRNFSRRPSDAVDEIVVDGGVANFGPRRRESCNVLTDPEFYAKDEHLHAMDESKQMDTI